MPAVLAAYPMKLDSAASVVGRKHPTEFRSEDRPVYLPDPVYLLLNAFIATSRRDYFGRRASRDVPSNHLTRAC